MNFHYSSSLGVNTPNTSFKKKYFFNSQTFEAVGNSDEVHYWKYRFIYKLIFTSSLSVVIATLLD